VRTKCQFGRLACCALGAALFVREAASAQTAKPPAQGAATPAPARGHAAAATSAKAEANLLQLMRGVLYPASNVLFAAQDTLTKWPMPADPSVSPNPLTTTYGGWQAVENAALAIAESANLVLLPRMCSNGKPAPVRRADWVKYTRGLRDVGLAAYKAAQMKSQDAMVDVAGQVSDTCAACHDVYREKKNGPQDRCLP